jgi:hypothetical protein
MFKISQLNLALLQSISVSQTIENSLKSIKVKNLDVWEMIKSSPYSIRQGTAGSAN